MGCKGCKDKKTKERATRLAKGMAKVTGKPQRVVKKITWEGEIYDFEQHAENVPKEDIISIVQVENGVFEIQYKKE
jgi:predicted SPOUT superfamily RNA methylase MTH1